MLLNVRGVGQVRLPQVVLVTSISPDYFGVMRVRLLKGRVFGEEDAGRARPDALHGPFALWSEAG